MFISLVSDAFVSVLPSLDSEMPTAGNHRLYTIIGQVFPPFQDNFCRPNDVRLTSLVSRAHHIHGYGCALDTSAVLDSLFHSPTIGGAKHPDWQRECCRSNGATNLRGASWESLDMFCEAVGLHYFPGIHFGVSILERSCIPMDLACRLVCSVTHDTEESFLILAGSGELVPREGSSRRPRIKV
jgi:hypothetical protein